MGLLGHFISDRSIFFFVFVLALPTILTLLIIRPDEIDYELARGAKKGEKGGQPVQARALLKDRPLMIFLVCAVMFHFANAAMLPLLGEMLAKVRPELDDVSRVRGHHAVRHYAARILGGRKRDVGRKPLLLIAFGVLPVRASYTLTHITGALIADPDPGWCGGNIGVVSVS